MSEIRLKQGETDELEVNFINKTDGVLPSDLTATLSVRGVPSIAKSSPITDLKATFNFTTDDTIIQTSTYRFKIKLSNIDETFVKFITGNFIIEDSYA